MPKYKQVPLFPLVRNDFCVGKSSIEAYTMGFQLDCDEPRPQFQEFFTLSSSLKGLVKSASQWETFPNWLAIPRKWWSSEISLGGGILLIASVFSGSGDNYNSAVD